MVQDSHLSLLRCVPKFLRNRVVNNLCKILFSSVLPSLITFCAVIFVLIVLPHVGGTLWDLWDILSLDAVTILHKRENLTDFEICQQV